MSSERSLLISESITMRTCEMTSTEVLSAHGKKVPGSIPGPGAADGGTCSLSL